MTSIRKRLQSTLRLPRAERADRSDAQVARECAPDSPQAPSRRSSGVSDDLRTLVADALWPIVETAFHDADERVDARIFQLEDLQVVISRAPAHRVSDGPAARRVTLELWPPAGPRVLVVEWSGRRPYVVHQREGAWLQRLREIARHSR